MSALNYTVFVDKVESREKRQTIRATRKRPIKLRERLHHFTGMRTKKCRRLCSKFEDHAKQVRRIEMRFRFVRPGVFAWEIKVEGKPLPTMLHLDLLARDDGFDGVDSFLKFFIRAAKPARKGSRISRFTGQIINW